MYSTNLLSNPAAIRSSLGHGDQFRGIVTYRRRLFHETLTVSAEIDELLIAVGLPALPQPAASPHEA